MAFVYGIPTLDGQEFEREKKRVVNNSVLNGIYKDVLNEATSDTNDIKLASDLIYKAELNKKNGQEWDQEIVGWMNDPVTNEDMRLSLLQGLALGDEVYDEKMIADNKLDAKLLGTSIKDNFKNNFREGFTKYQQEVERATMANIRLQTEKNIAESRNFFEKVVGTGLAFAGSVGKGILDITAAGMELFDTVTFGLAVDDQVKEDFYNYRQGLQEDLNYIAASNMGAGEFYLDENMEIVAVPNAFAEVVMGIGNQIPKLALTFLPAGQLLYAGEMLGENINDVNFNPAYKDASFSAKVAGVVLKTGMEYATEALFGFAGGKFGKFMGINAIKVGTTVFGKAFRSVAGEFIQEFGQTFIDHTIDYFINKFDSNWGVDSEGNSMAFKGDLLKEALVAGTIGALSGGHMYTVQQIGRFYAGAEFDGTKITGWKAVTTLNEMENYQNQQERYKLDKYLSDVKSIKGNENMTSQQIAEDPRYAKRYRKAVAADMITEELTAHTAMQIANVWKAAGNTTMTNAMTLLDNMLKDSQNTDTLMRTNANHNINRTFTNAITGYTERTGLAEGIMDVTASMKPTQRAIFNEVSGRIAAASAVGNKETLPNGIFAFVNTDPNSPAFIRTKDGAVGINMNELRNSSANGISIKMAKFVAHDILAKQMPKAELDGFVDEINTLYSGVRGSKVEPSERFKNVSTLMQILQSDHFAANVFISKRGRMRNMLRNIQDFFKKLKFKKENLFSSVQTRELTNIKSSIMAAITAELKEVAERRKGIGQKKGAVSPDAITQELVTDKVDMAISSNIPFSYTLEEDIIKAIARDNREYNETFMTLNADARYGGAHYEMYKRMMDAIPNTKAGIKPTIAEVIENKQTYYQYLKSFKQVEWVDTVRAWLKDNGFFLQPIAVTNYKGEIVSNTYVAVVPVDMREIISVTELQKVIENMPPNGGSFTLYDIWNKSGRFAKLPAPNQILNRAKQIVVKFDSPRPADAYYSVNQGEIHLSSTWIQSAKNVNQLAVVISAVIHESRHAYQALFGVSFGFGLSVEGNKQALKQSQALKDRLKDVMTTLHDSVLTPDGDIDYGIFSSHIGGEETSLGTLAYTNGPTDNLTMFAQRIIKTDGTHDMYVDMYHNPIFEVYLRNDNGVTKETLYTFKTIGSVTYRIEIKPIATNTPSGTPGTVAMPSNNRKNNNKSNSRRTVNGQTEYAITNQVTGQQEWSQYNPAAKTEQKRKEVAAVGRHYAGLSYKDRMMGFYKNVDLDRIDNGFRVNMLNGKVTIEKGAHSAIGYISENINNIDTNDTAKYTVESILAYIFPSTLVTIEDLDQLPTVAKLTKAIKARTPDELNRVMGEDAIADEQMRNGKKVKARARGIQTSGAIEGAEGDRIDNEGQSVTIEEQFEEAWRNKEARNAKILQNRTQNKIVRLIRDISQVKSDSNKIGQPALISKQVEDLVDATYSYIKLVQAQNKRIKSQSYQDFVDLYESAEQDLIEMYGTQTFRSALEGVISNLKLASTKNKMTDEQKSKFSTEILVAKVMEQNEIGHKKMKEHLQGLNIRYGRGRALKRSLGRFNRLDVVRVANRLYKNGKTTQNTISLLKYNDTGLSEVKISKDSDDVQDLITLRNELNKMLYGDVAKLHRGYERARKVGAKEQRGKGYGATRTKTRIEQVEVAEKGNYGKGIQSIASWRNTNSRGEINWGNTKQQRLRPGGKYVKFNNQKFLTDNQSILDSMTDEDVQEMNIAHKNGYFPQDINFWAAVSYVYRNNNIISADTKRQMELWTSAVAQDYAQFQNLRKEGGRGIFGGMLSMRASLPLAEYGISEDIANSIDEEFEDKIAEAMSDNDFNKLGEISIAYQRRVIEEAGKVKLNKKERIKKLIDIMHSQWRYTAMLSNPSTWLKAVVGNYTLKTVHKVSNMVARAIGGIDISDKSYFSYKAEVSETAKSFVSSEYESKGAFRFFGKGNKFSDSRNMSDASIKAAFGKHTTQGLREGRKYSGLGPVTDALNWYNGIINKFLSGSDEKHVTSTAITYMERFITQFEKKHDGKLPTREESDVFFMQSIHLAMGDFLRNNNKVYIKLMALADSHPSIKFMMATFAPFLRMSTNMMSMIWSYSPGGLARNLYKLIKFKNDVKKGNPINMFSEGEAKLGLAKGIVGSGLMAMGMLLFKAGIFKWDDDEEEMYADILGYKIDLDALNFDATMFMGAMAMRFFDGEQTFIEDMDDMVNQFIKEVRLDSVTQLNRYNTMGQTIFMSAPLTYALQFQPAIIKNMASILYNNKKYNYADMKTDYFAHFYQRWLGSILPNSWLGVSTYTDIYTGEAKKRNGLSWFVDVINVVSPVKVAKDSISPLEGQLRDLALTSGDNWKPKQDTSQTITINGVAYDINEKQKEQLGAEYGRINSDRLDGIINGGKTHYVKDEKTGKFRYKTWEQMTQNEKENAVDNILNQNYELYKIYYWTEIAGKEYFASNDTYKLYLQYFKSNSKFKRASGSSSGYKE